MTKIKPLQRQSLLDVALQECGSAEAVVEIAALNDISITETPDPAVELTVPKAYNSKVVAAYAVKDIRPATDISAAELEAMPYGGIGYMGIEIDFIVS